MFEGIRGFSGVFRVIWGSLGFGGVWGVWGVFGSIWRHLEVFDPLYVPCFILKSNQMYERTYGAMSNGCTTHYKIFLNIDLSSLLSIL